MNDQTQDNTDFIITDERTTRRILQMSSIHSTLDQIDDEYIKIKEILNAFSQELLSKDIIGGEDDESIDAADLTRDQLAQLLVAVMQALQAHAGHIRHECVQSHEKLFDYVRSTQPRLKYKKFALNIENVHYPDPDEETERMLRVWVEHITDDVAAQVLAEQEESA